jgi:hypothetical protein
VAGHRSGLPTEDEEICDLGIVGIELNNPGLGCAVVSAKSLQILITRSQLSLAFQTPDPRQSMKQLDSLSDQSQKGRLLDDAVFAKHVGLP